MGDDRSPTGSDPRRLGPHGPCGGSFQDRLKAGLQRDRRTAANKSGAGRLSRCAGLAPRGFSCRTPGGACCQRAWAAFRAGVGPGESPAREGDYPGRAAGCPCPSVFEPPGGAPCAREGARRSTPLTARRRFLTAGRRSRWNPAFKRSVIFPPQEAGEPSLRGFAFVGDDRSPTGADPRRLGPHGPCEGSFQDRLKAGLQRDRRTAMKKSGAGRQSRCAGLAPRDFSCRTPGGQIGSARPGAHFTHRPS